jgi:translation initiation factor IF-2
MQKNSDKVIERAPVVVIMGHIDHGKSTLLSYIRKSNKPLNEAGGITQHISAYEVEHTNKEGKKHNITFIDTPGHEAFGGIRKRGAKVADIAVLVVSAEDGVKPQTLDALRSIRESSTPFIVAINKIDKPGADIEKTKQSLAENEIYIEGYGGDVPCIPISSKTGVGVPDLLDMITLVAELGELKGDPDALGSGIVLESNRDIKKGISATCVIQNGKIEKGMFVVSGVAISPIRIMENYLGKPLNSATFSSPVKIIGWDELPKVGDAFMAFENQKDAREAVALEKEKRGKEALSAKTEINENIHYIPLVIKADTGSSLEAMLSEIKKLKTERTEAKILSSGIGPVGESDVRLADGTEKAILIGFNVKIDAPAKALAERNGIEVEMFDIIYKMNEWLKETLLNRTPKQKVVETQGRAKILKIFSKVKDRQILGARVDKGSISLGSEVKIFRRDAEIGTGKIKELQKQKNPATEVSEGQECGTMIVSNTEIAAGDYVESFTIIMK